MRVRKFLRILCLTLAMITVLSSVAFASSARASKYLSAYYATISETSDGNISIYFNVIAPRKMEHLGVSKIKERQNANGTSSANRNGRTGERKSATAEGEGKCRINMDKPI